MISADQMDGKLGHVLNDDSQGFCFGGVSGLLYILLSIMYACKCHMF